MTVSSALKRKEFTENQIPVVADIIRHYKSVGYKVVDANETIIIIEPDSTFRIFISRVSHCLQFYYLGEHRDAKEFSTHNLESAAQIVNEECRYKEMFG
jgi:hypothetical protein